jgi:hypothetical protein
MSRWQDHVQARESLIAGANDSVLQIPRKKSLVVDRFMSKLTKLALKNKHFLGLCKSNLNVV